MTNGGITVDAATGVVRGIVPAESPETSTFSLKFPGPRHGLVSLMHDTFVYTPTQAGRLRAGFTAGADTDSFTVRVTGEHGTSLVELTVPVTPSRVVVANALEAPVYPAAAALSPDGSRLYLTYYTGTLAITPVAGGGVRTIAIPTRASAVAVSPDGQRVYVSHSDSGTVTVRDADGNLVRTDRVGDEPWGIALSPDGSRLYVANHASDSVTATNTATGQVETVLRVDGPWTLAVSPGGEKLYVSIGESQQLGILDLQSHSVEVIPLPKPVWHLSNIAPSRDGSRVYIPGGFAQTVVMAMNTADNSVATASVPMDPSGVAVSPDGSLLYATSVQSDALHLIDAWTLRQITTIPVSDETFYSPFVSRDGNRVYAIGKNGSAGVVAVDFVQL